MAQNDQCYKHPKNPCIHSDLIISSIQYILLQPWNALVSNSSSHPLYHPTYPILRFWILTYKTFPIHQYYYVHVLPSDIMIKPDGVQRGLIGKIIARFEDKGFKLIAMKLISPGVAHMEKHYADLATKKFFPGLISYMTSGPVCAMVWEGAGAVATGRKMLGATLPSESEPGTIRGDYCIEVGRNICHGSDSVESAEAEIALWFPEGVSEYESCQKAWVYE